ncbi:hypothetical protein HanRHA438_Chr15g0710251 [Helianthus annuus]|nr:hypothetical protein HanRHA438_Chr15g0710251 [Helianthus annuus]
MIKGAKKKKKKKKKPLTFHHTYGLSHIHKLETNIFYKDPKGEDVETHII